MEGSLGFGKQEGPVATWSRPPVLEFGKKIDGKPCLSCTNLSKSIEDEINNISSPAHVKNEDNDDRAVPDIVIHREDQVSSQTSCAALLEEHSDASAIKDIGRDVTLIVEQNKASNSLDEHRGRSPTRTAAKRPILKGIRAILKIDLANDAGCRANNQKGNRCKAGIAKRSIDVAKAILKKLEAGDPDVNHDNLSRQLRSLAELLHCKGNHQKDAPLICRKWEIIIGLRSEPLSTPEPVVPVPDVRHTNILTKTTILTNKFDTSRVCIRTFIPYDPLAQAQICTERFVTGAITQNLTPKEQKTGLIYIYWFPGNFGHIKIGVTTRAVAVRLREWETKCKHKTHLDFPLNEADQELIPHVFRVEKIVQAQLRNSQKKEMRCNGCGKCHKEWFERSKDEAIAAVRYWSTWIRKNPYEQTAGGVWKLRKDQKKDLKTLCQSIPQTKQERSISTSRLRERQERYRRGLSVSPHSHPRANLAEPPRRSQRIAGQQRRKNLMGSEVPDAKEKWTFNLEA
ncbi:MAG: hypothetical protein Q9170_004843 [Blastenia crenularia]